LISSVYCFYIAFDKLKKSSSSSSSKTGLSYFVNTFAMLLNPIDMCVVELIQQQPNIGTILKCLLIAIFSKMNRGFAVQCPVCFTEVPSQFINHHLDTCVDNGTSQPMKTSSQSTARKPSSSQHNNHASSKPQTLSSSTPPPSTSLRVNNVDWKRTTSPRIALVKHSQLSCFERLTCANVAQKPTFSHNIDESVQRSNERFWIVNKWL
jgi:hypothetical protein